MANKNLSLANLTNLSSIFEQNGFVVIKNVFTNTEIAEIKFEVENIVKKFLPANHPLSTFNTHDENKHVKDEYFLKSASNISFFYEENAVKNQKLVIEKNKSLNKIGHALHILNPVFKKYTFSDKIKKIFKELNFKEPKIVQSMYIFKQPLIGGAVLPHVDSTFLQTNYNNLDYTFKFGPVVGVWIAIDSATEENSCLRFVPSSHKKTKSDYKFIRLQEMNNSNCKKELLKFEGNKPNYDFENYEAVPVEKGSIILIDSNVIHKSDANTSLNPRHAYTFHVYESAFNVEWSKSNWLSETEHFKFPLLYQ